MKMVKNRKSAYSSTRLEKKLKFKLALWTISAQILFALGKSWFIYFLI